MVPYKVLYRFDANIFRDIEDEFLKKETPSATQRISKSQRAGLGSEFGRPAQGVLSGSEQG
jgi:hypothetical protein